MNSDYCPDCGEPLNIRRGVIPLTGTRYCPSCEWCEVMDGKRQKDAVQDWMVRNVHNNDEGKTTLEIMKERACEQFAKRCQDALLIDKINNADLYAESPMYYYCKHCGIPTEVLPEDYLFPPYMECSQCKGLKDEGWLQSAIVMWENYDSRRVSTSSENC